MSTADKLLEEILSWIQHREKCAGKLKTLAKELEGHRKRCNVSECIGSTTAVFGTACLIGAGVATFVTGGAAAPLLGVAVTGLGTAVSVGTKIIEHFISSSTMKDAQKIESEIKKTTEKIQKSFETLRAEKQQTSSCGDDLDQQIMREILKAMARRSGVGHHFLLNMLDNNVGLFIGRSNNATILQLNFTSMMLTLGSILSFFTLEASGNLSKILFIKGGQQLGKEFSKIGLKTALKGGAMAVGGVIGLAFEFPEAVNQWNKLIRNNHVTAASQSLRDTADDLLKISQTLREQLNKIEQMFKDFEEMKSCIENSNRSSQQKKDFIKRVKKYCDDKEALTLLEKLSIKTFNKLINIFNLLEKELDKKNEKKKKKKDREEVDIIFVAHGSIEENSTQEPLIPASTLLPLPTLKDVVLYSPWNCAINASVAYGIATGDLKPKHRQFCCIEGKNCQHGRSHKPTNLPCNWNSMKNAGSKGIPTIYVSPLREPEDGAWEAYKFLESKYGEPGKTRVVVPFKLPPESKCSMRIQLRIVTLALSIVLFIFPHEATFHLAACLGKYSAGTFSKHEKDLNEQYSWAIDRSAMICSERSFCEHPELYEALRAVFDR